MRKKVIRLRWWSEGCNTLKKKKKKRISTILLLLLSQCEPTRQKSLEIPVHHLWIHVLANCLSEAGTCHACSFWDVSMMTLAFAAKHGVAALLAWLLSHSLSLHLSLKSTLGISCHTCGVVLRGGALWYFTPWSAFSNCVWHCVPNSSTLSWCLNWICLCILGSYTHVYIIRCPTPGVPFCTHPILMF